MLVATDLASRGIDVADISHIINYDIPDDPEAYVHRVGRTARMGAAGKAFTFVSRDQGDELTKVENLINMVIPQATIEGWEPRPTPSDWTEGPPGAMQMSPSKPIVNRFDCTDGRVVLPGRNRAGNHSPRGTSGARSPSTEGTSANAEPFREAPSPGL